MKFEVQTFVNPSEAENIMYSFLHFSSETQTQEVVPVCATQVST